MTNIVSLVIPFIAIAIISVLVDVLTLWIESVMHAIPKLPDKLEWWVAYLIVLGASYAVCWQGDFNLFNYLDFHFWYLWEGYLITALVVSGGSTFVRTQFGMINSIPSMLFGLTANVSQLLRRRELNQLEQKELLANPDIKKQLEQQLLQQQLTNNSSMNESNYYGGYGGSYVTPTTDGTTEEVTPVTDDQSAPVNYQGEGSGR
jgi:hypothetical protein